ncbi:GntR family transcriptional regulator [Tissierella pigra]|uniref:GntR family transcriptional regulator n=1 Tax=Tissierella pigra TaxID=2607614 RepID=A0A6N7XGD0_9FIRM|nr:GntR family transcriptional regulator [Tissierella pigra]MBU5426127.1 GntR family transcriptional regulator [Tissierella pigra]MSU00756.1 GntR family transcriptional regulator [Tissierella pigra]
MTDIKLDTDKIYEILKSRIIHLEYEPGLVLNEVDLAEEFNISRTPIRKVFQLLHSDKLLNIVPRFGAQVTPIDFKQMKYIFEVTRELDPFASRLAVERISEEKVKELEEIMLRFENYDIGKDYQNAINDDEQFHSIILSSCGNPWLQDILTSLHYHTERLWHYCEQYFDSIDLFSHTLGKVLEGIKEKDLDKVEQYAREHIDEFVFKIKKEML